MAKERDGNAVAAYFAGMDRGKFITFEGGDGVGKSTQIERLARRLGDYGVDCVLTREPGGTPFAERVRAFILGGELPPHPAMSEALLFAAARFDHVHSLIAPALAQGRWVLCDRFADSTRAYQGAAGGVEAASLMQLEGLSHGACGPDLTLVLDLDPALGRGRIAGRTAGDGGNGNDPFEGRDMAFQNRLREAFLAIARDEPQRCEIVDAGRDADSVEAGIWTVVSRRLGLEGS